MSISALIERRYRRPILPAKPEKVDGEKGYEPPEIVLFVDEPFAAELSPKCKPQRG
jgi:hypothetical protein